MRGIFITGTDTAVGKTTIGIQLARILRENGERVRARKPVETGCEKRAKGAILEPSDAVRLQVAAGALDALETVCPHRFEPQVSPEWASRLANRPLELGDLHAACLKGVGEGDFLLVEGAGGFYSPIARGALNADLAAGMGLPVLLVVADRLGAVNQTLLAIEAIHMRGLALLGVVLNQVSKPDNPFLDNHADLQRWLSAPVLHRTHNCQSDHQLAQWVKNWVGES